LKPQNLFYKYPSFDAAGPGKLMFRFAHMSDIHIGAFGQRELKDPLLKAFENAVDLCIEKKVDFIIMAGDIFDSNIPDLSSVRRAASKVREAKEKGIRFYVVYGSHDFSPNYSSIIDVLESAGLFTRVDRVSDYNGKIRLTPVIDATGAKLTGLSGKKLALDRIDYERVDFDSLQNIEGFKVFIFHGAIEELKPQGLERMEAMSSRFLPENFDYYAGGHVHQRSLSDLPGRKNIAYPGPLFGADYKDLENIARGEERGFYLVEFDTQVRNVEFIKIETVNVEEIDYSAEGKSSLKAQDELNHLADEIDAENKIILLKVHGQLLSGKTSDIDFVTVRKVLKERGAIYVLLNYSQLTSKEQIAVPVLGKSRTQTEQELFREMVSRVNLPNPRLTGDRGVATSLELLRILKERKRENEVKSEYEERLLKSAMSVLGLES
jgi:exonuclease SbcD